MGQIRIRHVPKVPGASQTKGGTAPRKWRVVMVAYGEKMVRYLQENWPDEPATARYPIAPYATHNSAPSWKYKAKKAGSNSVSMYITNRYDYVPHVFTSGDKERTPILPPRLEQIKALYLEEMKKELLAEVLRKGDGGIGLSVRGMVRPK